MSDVAQRSGHASRILRVLGIVLVFVLLGPPIGAVIFMVTALGLGSAKGTSDLGIIAAFAMIYAAPLSYFVGSGPAAIAGLIVGIRQAYFGRATWLFAAGAGIVVGLGMMLASGESLSLSSEVPAAIYILTCVVPTMICWLVVRGWHLANELGNPGR